MDKISGKDSLHQPFPVSLLTPFRNRKRYIDDLQFLSQSFNPKEIYIRSTDMVTKLKPHFIIFFYYKKKKKYK